MVTGTDLKAARLEAGWSQRELARRSGLSHKAVQYWEAKPALDPRGYGVQRMSKALGWRIFRTFYARDVGACL